MSRKSDARVHPTLHALDQLREWLRDELSSCPAHQIRSEEHRHQLLRELDKRLRPIADAIRALEDDD